MLKAFLLLISGIAMLTSVPLASSRINIMTQVKSAVDSSPLFLKESSFKSPHKYITTLRAGGNNEDDSRVGVPFGETLKKNLLGLWGVLQVVYILTKAIKRLFPVAMQPILQKDLLPFQWAMYGLWSIYMMYTEGYKAFQLKFSPLVVERSFGLAKTISERPATILQSLISILSIVLAGPYSMGLFCAPRRRMIIGWSLTAGVFSLVKIVKLLPYPYRSIVDAGVVAGLSYGTLSICFLTVKALLFGSPLSLPLPSAVASDASSNKAE